MELQLLDTKFDFLENAFKKAENTRKGFLVATILAAGFLGFQTLTGLQAMMENQTNVTAQASTEKDTAAKQQALLQQDSFKGFAAEDISIHVTERCKIYKTVAEKQVDNLGFIGSILNSAPGYNIEVNSIGFTDGDPGSGTTETPTAISVVGTGPDIASVEQYSDKLNASGLLIPAAEGSNFSRGDEFSSFTFAFNPSPESLANSAKDVTSLNDQCQDVG